MNNPIISTWYSTDDFNPPIGKWYITRCLNIDNTVLWIMAEYTREGWIFFNDNEYQPSEFKSLKDREKENRKIVDDGKVTEMLYVTHWSHEFEFEDCDE